MTKSTMTLSRQQLYDEIWQMSVAGVARKYNLNYAKLIAKCREANIPFPPSGYWTRKNMGKDVSGEVVALPPSDNENVELLLAGVKSEKKKKVISDAEELHSDMEEGLKKAALMTRFYHFWTVRKRNVYYRPLLNSVFVIKRDCMSS